jgi:hypothetical protein
MAQQTLNVGSNANDGTGDTLRSAMLKVNDMFTELYLSPLTGGDLDFSGNEISAIRSNDDLVFSPAGTGAVAFPAIRINDNNIEGTRSNENINLLPNGTGSVIFGALKINGTSLSSDDSTAININENLIVDGTASVSGTATVGTLNAATGSTIGNLTLANGSITDSSGDISFGDENITTTGTMTAATGSTIGNLTLANGSITDSSGDISFGDENITTTGTLDVSGLTTLSTLSVTGATTLTGTTTIDNITFNDNIIATSSNADLNLTPGGTGTVNISNLTIDSNINITDNTITTTQSNSELVLSASGTGSVVMAKADINSGAIDNTVIGATTPVAATFTTLSTTSGMTIDGVTITDNTISSNASNADLELSGNGTGTVSISGFSFPTSDGSADQVLKTDGAGNIGFVTISSASTLNHSEIGDNTATVATSATTVIDSWSSASYRSAKYYISISDTTNSRFEMVEATLVHGPSADSTTEAYVTVFGNTGSYTDPLCTFTADIDDGNVRLLATNITNDSTVFKFQRIIIDL